MGNFDKPYEELLFSDNFMFVKVMELRPDLCKEMLELLLSVKIDRVECISSEKAVETFYDSRGIRLDVLVKDSNDCIYDAEMQVAVEPDMPKRSRYYHSAIDTDFLLRGNSYESLKPVYVIFICVGKLNFDILKPLYFFESIERKTGIVLPDMRYTIIVNSDYINTNPDDDTVSEELKDFLQLVNKGKTHGGANTLAGKIEKLINNLKENNEGRPKYMTVYEEMQLECRRKYNKGHVDGLAEGLEEGRAEGLEEGRAVGLAEGKLRVYKELVENGHITPDIAAEGLGISVEEFNLKIKSI